MIVTLSPAKTLDFDKTIPYKKHTVPQFLADSEKLVSVLRKKSAKELETLMGISGDLAKLNYDRYQQWKTPFTEKNARPCLSG